ncbi:ANK, partial [Musa troglodytarum]
MTQGNCPSLPSWLLSTVENNTKGTILHFASTKGPGDDQAAVQMQDELIWFEMVRDMVPRELVHYRNDAEKTAQEMFSERHKEMAKACKVQPVGMGQTCSGLLAAVVFASSFSIPGEKDPATGNPVYLGRLPFRIFSHAFVIGLSSAATSLVLFLSLLVAPYKEQQFRRAIPLKYFFACLSFGIALLAFLVAFTCNIFLQIYGGQRSGTKDLIMILLELIVFPVLFSSVFRFFLALTQFLSLCSNVATELVRNNKDIIKERNSKLETPLHKAALYGHRDMFWQYPELITSRNEEAVAPLQLMVTIPELFRSQMVLGSLESFLFRLIPLEEDAPKTRDGDEEAPKSMDRADATEEIEEDDYEHLERPRRIRSKFPSQYTPLLDLLELMHIPARWIQVFLFNILKQLSPRIRRLEEIKRTHREALQLIEHLVHKEEYVDFFSQGTDKGKGHAETSNDNGVDKAAHEHAQEVTGERHRESGGRRDQLVIAFAEKFFKFASHGNDKVTAQELRKCMQDAMGALSAESARWNEPPLILGAQMGLPEYVRTILKVSPEAATYLDTEGRSVLQVAIEHGNLEIVETIREMTEGHNPILPSWLLSSVDETTGETILHFASVKGPDNYQDAVQMQDELRWFEIAQGHRHQIESRNEHALTPLQLLVTIPEAFRSQVVLGALDSFIYDWIPLEEDSSKMNKRDEEAANRSSIGVAQEDDGDHSPRSFRSKFPSNYSTLFDLLEFINIPVSPRVQRMERKKKNHTETMHLIEYLAQAGYFEFFVRGKDPTQVTTIASEALDGQFGPPETPPETVQEGHAEKKDTEAPDAVKELIQGMSDKLYKLVSVESETPVSTAIKEAAQSVEKVLKALSPSSEERWNEPPLILGAQMGLHDFVGKILQVCPQSATYLDTKGRNVLRVAIESGNRETVETIRGMTQGDNPILPSWLLSSIDSKTRNTILHFASEKVGDAGDDAVQMQDEIRWFEGSPFERREVGATMLHCANMGNAPGLALEIAENFPVLITSRNTMAVTPLQLMVTVPGLFRSQMVLGSSESILYYFIPLEKDSHRTRRRDEEEAAGSFNDALYPRTRHLDKIKRTHRKALELIEYLARDPTNMEFDVLGRKQDDGGAPAAGLPERGGPQDQPNASAASIRRWNEPPLILGAQMGIPEFVSTILQVCPEAATYLDTRGRSVLQVAIEHGNREIVRTIREMTRGKNPILRSWLLSRMVRDMVPKELVYSRNVKEMTTEEMFTESHQAMLRSCKGQLMETGRTCSGLVAAVVFASSFSIPDDKDPATGNPIYFGRAAFNVFSHAYVIELSCAATSLLYGWWKAKSKDLIPFVLELTVFH